MTSEQRRESIARAAMPLMAQYDAVTMADIARAAGMDEADLLAVFDDKEAVMQACIHTMQAYIVAALDPTEVVRELRAIPPGRPLAERLVAATRALDTYTARAMVSLDSWMDPGVAPDRPAPDGASPGHASGRRQYDTQDVRFASRTDVVLRAVTELLEPDQERLRLRADFLADAFLGMYPVRRPTPPAPPAPPAESTRSRIERPELIPLPAEDFVDLFLHGALSSPAGGESATR